MNKETLEFMKAKSHEMMDSSACSVEAKQAAQNWLAAVGTEKEEAETQKYFTELQEDVLPIEDLIHFTESAEGEKIFGAETARMYAAHGRELKAKGEKYCDCPACAAALAILGVKDNI